MELFFAANTAVNLSLFSVFTLPTIVFGTLCEIGLLLTKKINWKLKVILVNVIAVDIVYSVGQILWYLGYPLRAYGGDDKGYSCAIAPSFSISTFFARPASFMLYAIVAYVFIKYGEDRIKWRNLVLSLITIQVFSLALFVSHTTGALDTTIATNGFCKEQVTANSSLLVILTAAITITAAVACIVVTQVFSFLAACYVKNHTIQDDSSIRQEMTRFLFFQWINITAAAVASACGVAVIALDLQSTILSLSLDYLFGSVLFDICVLLSPLACFVILKPIKEALRDLCN